MNERETHGEAYRCAMRSVERAAIFGSFCFPEGSKRELQEAIDAIGVINDSLRMATQAINELMKTKKGIEK